MRVTHQQTDLSGFIPDLASDTLPPGATSAGENLMPTVRGWEKVPGFGPSGSRPTNEATHMMYWTPTEGDFRWVVAGATTIQGIQGGSIVDHTRVGNPYNASGEWSWNSLNFNGIVIFNNGVDSPQWLTDSGKFEDFPALPANVRFKVVRAFNNYLIGLGVDTGGGFKPSELYWSHPADPGFMPVSWDYTDPAFDAAITTIPGAGYLMDALPLGDINIIYKTDSTHLMRLIGGNFVFRFDIKFAESGILTTGCVAAYENKHFVVTQSDIIVHDAIQLKSVADERTRRYFFDNLNQGLKDRTFVMANADDKEMLIFYPSKDSTGLCDKVLVWNWVLDAWHERKLLDVKHAGIGYSAPESTDYWNIEVGDWDSDTTTWLEGDLGISTKTSTHVSSDAFPTLMSETHDGALDGTLFVGKWERENIKLGQISRDGVVRQAYDIQKTLNAVQFNVETQDDFQVFIGYKDNLNDTTVWEDYGVVMPEDRKRVDCLITAGYISLRILTKDPAFILRGLIFDFELSGDIW